MEKVNVAVLGATGAVGRTMIRILQERRFPMRSLKLLASPHSAGKVIDLGAKTGIVEEFSPAALKDVDLVFGAVENDLAEEYAPLIQRSGALFVDNSSAFRLDPDVPLVIPEINARDIRWHHGIVANPNCATILAMMALSPILKLTPITRMIVSTYQAVSGAGMKGMDELERQIRDPSAAPDVFPFPIAFNVIPQIGEFDEAGISSEEWKMQNEGRRILHEASLQVCCTCVRVPVYRCHSESIYVETHDAVSLQTIRQAAEDCSGIVLNEAPYPTPKECTDSDIVMIGRLRRDGACEKGLHLWCCCDQLRKGAATNAVQIGEWAWQNGLLKKGV